MAIQFQSLVSDATGGNVEVTYSAEPYQVIVKLSVRNSIAFVTDIIAKSGQMFLPDIHSIYAGDITGAVECVPKVVGCMTAVCLDDYRKFADGVETALKVAEELSKFDFCEDYKVHRESLSTSWYTYASLVHVEFHPHLNLTGELSTESTRICEMIVEWLVNDLHVADVRLSDFMSKAVVFVEFRLIFDADRQLSVEELKELYIATVSVVQPAFQSYAENFSRQGQLSTADVQIDVPKLVSRHAQ